MRAPAWPKWGRTGACNGALNGRFRKAGQASLGPQWGSKAADSLKIRIGQTIAEIRIFKPKKRTAPTRQYLGRSELAFGQSQAIIRLLLGCQNQHVTSIRA